MKFRTAAIHAGQHPDETTGAVMTPIYQTSTYAQEAIGKNKGYDYGRTINPTRSALEANLAALESGKFGFAFASGMSAISAALSLVAPGKHVIASRNMYGGTFRLFDKILKPLGVSFSYVDMKDVANIERALTSSTAMIYCETPTNPMMELTDLRSVATIAQSKKILSVVDNTFMSPYFQRPLELGCDIVAHSSTKYLGGHSDVIGGCVLTSNKDVAAQLKFYQNSVGAVPAPFDAWLLLRSTKTLAVRMEGHEANAKRIAAYLVTHKKVQKVFYPGLPSHPQHELAKKQMSGFGGMISIDLGGFASAQAFASNVKLFTLAESLGGVESLVCHPVSMTHGSIPKADREAFGLTDGIIRLSVGIEDCDDLLSDIEGALEKV